MTELTFKLVRDDDRIILKVIKVNGEETEVGRIVAYCLDGTIQAYDGIDDRVPIKKVRVEDDDMEIMDSLGTRVRRGARR